MAQVKLAEALEVDLQELRTKYEAEYEPVRAEANTASEEEVVVEEVKSQPKPARPRIVYRRVHRRYLRILLQTEVGSAYTALGERGLELHCNKLPWEGVLEVVSKRRREAEVLRELLRDTDLADPYDEVRLFLEAAVSGYPDQDIRILAAARSREGSEKG